MAITFSVFTEHIKSLGKNQQDKAMLCLSPEMYPGCLFSPPTWGFPGRTEGSYDSFLNCMTNINRFFYSKTQTV